MGGGCTPLQIGGILHWGSMEEQAHASILFTLFVYSPAFPPSLSGQNINQCLFRWKMASTHTQTHSVAENKTSVAVLLAACQLAARLCVQSRAKSLMRPGPLVQMKGTGKGAQSPSDCRKSISQNHILKIFSCSGRQ